MYQLNQQPAARAIPRAAGFVFVTALLVAFPASANAGVPMIFLTLPGMVYALVPIIGIETFVLNRSLQIGAKKSAVSAIVANAISTFVGMPITWLLLVVIQFSLDGGGGGHGIDTALQKLFAVTVQAPWLIPYEDHLYWLIPVAMLYLLIPFFFASWLIEYFVVRWMVKQAPITNVMRAVRNANLVSYALLTGLVILYSVFSVREHFQQSGGI